MTAQEELTKLEAAYSAWLDAGCPQSYTTPAGQQVTKASADWMSKRIDVLRAQVQRDTSGSFFVAQNRESE